MAQLQDQSKTLTNSAERFGSVTKVLHWLTAILIFSLLVLGVAASKWPYDTSAALAVKASLFSIHKTLGLATFAVALLRILWALTQPHPAPVSAGSRIQHFAAQTVHFALYGALVLVPLTGWFHHAATTGFAPILWPFGQDVAFIPKSQSLAEVFGRLHFVFNIVLVGTIALHVAAALKHHVIDKDATLRRMLPGRVDLPAALPKQPFQTGPVFAALGIWAGAAVIAGVTALNTEQAAPVAQAPIAAAGPSGWTVTDGTLTIALDQFGQSVSGVFEEWTAAINFAETAGDGVHGDVSVTISIPSLVLASMTNDALSAEFLNAAEFATAVYSGPIVSGEQGNYLVDGTLQLVGREAPLPLPFALTLDGNTAQAQGAAQLDRRDFNIGASYTDESSVGFDVTISFDLTAERAGR